MEKCRHSCGQRSWFFLFEMRCFIGKGWKCNVRTGDQNGRSWWSWEDATVPVFMLWNCNETYSRRKYVDAGQVKIFNRGAGPNYSGLDLLFLQIHGQWISPCFSSSARVYDPRWHSKVLTNESLIQSVKPFNKEIDWTPMNEWNPRVLWRIWILNVWTAYILEFGRVKKIARTFSPTVLDSAFL